MILLSRKHVGRRNKTRTTLARRDLPKNSMPHRILQKRSPKKHESGRQFQIQIVQFNHQLPPFGAIPFETGVSFVKEFDAPAKNRVKKEVRAGSEAEQTFKATDQKISMNWDKKYDFSQDQTFLKRYPAKIGIYKGNDKK